MKEIELYEPIRSYFSERGYNVDGEVGGVDILCVAGEDVIAIELKNDLNLKLITQTALRQKMFKQVYAAIWSPPNLRSKAFMQKVYLLQRLGIGLILVTKRLKQVRIFHEAKVHEVLTYQRRNKGKRDQLTKELGCRRLKTNVGGSNKAKIMTAYKENALIVLDILVRYGPKKAAEIKKITGISNSYNIIYHNPMKWFERVDKGLYDVSSCGRDAHKAYIETIKQLRLTLDGMTEDE